VLFGIAHLRPALGQAWPPFVLVAGLLALGQLAGADGLFEAAASRLQRLPGPPLLSLLACLLLVLVVTALLNLDTSAVFVTPVLIGVARRRRLQVAPFLYGSIFMANASSLFLPGSNLTNLLVLSGRHQSGGAFLVHMLPVALAAPLATALGLVLLHRRALARAERPQPGTLAAVHRGAGLLGATLAAILMVALRNAALAVLALALMLLVWRWLRGGPSPARALASLGLPTLAGLFCVSVALGVLGRSGLVSLEGLRSAGVVATAGGAALTSVLINNLPAAVLLSSSGHLSPRALLLGLNVGPNLAVSGSLAVLLWWRAASAAGVRPSALEYSRQGLLLAPLALALALAAAAI
jgi:arsenical pump membrane protein